MIAALFVATNGCYFGIDGVDAWDLQRDARLYEGPFPVIAHPPCERWGRYWYGQAGTPVGSPKRKKMGDDNGCFESALSSVRTYGGVIEHPEASHAWAWFGLKRPPWKGGWVPADNMGGFTCCVCQGHYGHLARKMTWLYVFGIPFEELPQLKWGATSGQARIEDSFRSAADRRECMAKRRHAGAVGSRLSSKARAATPIPFRDMLISIAERCNPGHVAPRFGQRRQMTQTSGKSG